jgi:hypothetical protein
MKAEAIPLGAKLLQQEASLDRQFANHSITAESLKTMAEQIGVTRAALRDTHLKYHLQTAEILTPAQMQQYSMLRDTVRCPRCTITRNAIVIRRSLVGSLSVFWK